MKKIVAGVIFLTLVYADTTTTTRWPIVGATDKIISSNLGDYRLSHIHLGFDIPQDTVSVRSYTKTFVYLGRSWGGVNVRWIVAVDHLSDDSACDKEYGSKYIHMDTVNTTLVAGNIYSDVNLANNTGFLDDHLHFDLYSPTAGDTISIDKAINPMVQDTVLKPEDIFTPLLDKMYVDGSLRGSATINCLNFLGYSFASLYADTTSGLTTFQKLQLHATPENDMDDPHIIVSGNCNAKFIVRCYDNFSDNNDRGAPYELGLYLDTNIVDCVQDHYKVKFDFVEYHQRQQEEDIYHLEPPCSTVYGTEAQFYRLYHYDVNYNGLPSCIVSLDTLKTENLEEGLHRIMVRATDFHAHIITGDVYFYIRTSNWVDFRRGFKE